MCTVRNLLGGHSLPQIPHGELTIKDATTTADICAVNFEIVQRAVLVDLCFSGVQCSHPVPSVQKSYHPFPKRAGREPGRSAGPIPLATIWRRGARMSTSS